MSEEEYIGISVSDEQDDEHFIGLMKYEAFLGMIERDPKYCCRDHAFDLIGIYAQRMLTINMEAKFVIMRVALDLVAHEEKLINAVENCRGDGNTPLVVFETGDKGGNLWIVPMSEEEKNRTLEMPPDGVQVVH